MQLISNPNTGQQGSSTWNAGCTATEATGDAVYVLSAGQVRQAQADDETTTKVVGFITSKPTATTCVVASGGAVPVAGVTAGAVHYLSPSSLGGITTTEPVAGNWVVVVGTASTSGTLVAEIGEPEYKS
jgi:hypothetical protein